MSSNKGGSAVEGPPRVVANADGGGGRLKEYFGAAPDVLALLPSWSLILGVSMAVSGGGRPPNPSITLKMS